MVPPPPPPTVYRAAVVGAGPAGVALLGQLLDLELTPILWIDPHFNGGRLARYREVPSNTKTRLFAAFGTACHAFGGEASLAVQGLKQLDPESGCELRHAHDMVVKLGQVVQQSDQVESIKALVTRLESTRGGKWKVVLDTACRGLNQDGAVQGRVDGDIVIEADMVLLATGSHPKSPSTTTNDNHHRILPLDTVLSPTLLAQAVKPDDVVGVVGSSHSAVLALKNLSELTPPVKKIINYYRSPLRYAEYRNDEHGSWIYRDNTGLKGVAAEWAKRTLESPSSWPSNLERIESSKPEHCTAVVYAIGYERNSLPTIVYNGVEMTDCRHDPLTGEIAKNLFGFGIAFPEKWTDPFGNEEDSVGLWKFMRYIKRVVVGV